ncbi:hypothetical protein HAX54_007510, partial [Datura stramonium]|nr:hypothetical protein [Datura stramonium]
DDNDEEQTFLTFRRISKTYSQKELRALSNVVVDAYHDLIKEKNTLAIELEESKVEKSFLADEHTKLNEEFKEASRENSLLNDKLGKCLDSESKGKKGCSETHLDMESELKKVKINLIAQLERNEELEKDLSKIKPNLDKSLRWMWSSQELAFLNLKNV